MKKYTPIEYLSDNGRKKLEEIPEIIPFLT